MIFVSYSWIDFSIAHSLKEYFDILGYRTWIDRDNLDLAAPLEKQIMQAVRHASILLFLDSSNSRLSNWVRQELIWADNAGVKIVNWPVALIKRKLYRHVLPISVYNLNLPSHSQKIKERKL